MGQNANFNDQLNAILEEVRAVKVTVDKTQETIEVFASDISKLKAENAECKSKIEELSNQNRMLSEQVNELEQYSRIDNIIISGVPYEPNENIQEIVTSIAKNLEVEINEHDINAVHRLSANKDKIPSIIVRLNSRMKKQKLIQNSKRKRLHGKNLNMNPAVPIYVSEHMSANTMSIFRKAMELKSQGAISYAWVKEGKIYIRENENDPARRIKDIQDLPDPKEEIHHEKSTESGTSQENDTIRSTRSQPPQTLSELGRRKTGRGTSRNRRK